jgi:phosphatidylinositol glycan class W
MQAQHGIRHQTHCCLAFELHSHQQVHESEHGRHWNFFITMAVVVACDRVVAAVGAFGSWMASCLLALMLASTHELFLMAGAREYILYQPRVDLLSANKEGVCTIVGFWALFRLGRATGQLVAGPDAWPRLAGKFLAAGIALRLLWACAPWATELTSRRMVCRGEGCCVKSRGCM